MLPKLVLTRLLQESAIFLNGHIESFLPVNRLPDFPFLVRILYVHRQTLSDGGVLSPITGSVHRS
jgi:hypothetical protein